MIVEKIENEITKHLTKDKSILETDEFIKNVNQVLQKSIFFNRYEFCLIGKNGQFEPKLEYISN